MSAVSARLRSVVLFLVVLSLLAALISWELWLVATAWEELRGPFRRTAFVVGIPASVFLFVRGVFDLLQAMGRIPVLIATSRHSSVLVKVLTSGSLLRRSRLVMVSEPLTVEATTDLPMRAPIGGVYTQVRLASGSAQVSAGFQGRLDPAEIDDFSLSVNQELRERMEPRRPGASDE